MTDNDNMSDHKLQTECNECAQDIFDAMIREDLQPDETPENHADDMSDRAHETAEGHQWVIYTYKAHRLCLYCNTDQGEAFLEDVGMPETVTYDSSATIIAYGEMRARIDSKLQELVDEWEPK